jgi:AmmeMemoRadiSam system protein A
LLTVAKRRGLAVETLDLRNSGDTAGPRDRVVGYGAWAFTERRPSPSVLAGQGDADIERYGPLLISLARSAIESAVHGNNFIVPGNLPPLLAAPGAAFVTLKKDGALRGCIGSIEAWRPLVTDVADNAVRAALQDPRFPPVGIGEVTALAVSVSVLTPPQPMTFADEADLLAQLHPGIDGLIIEDGPHRALFLPAVWETLPDPQAFLDHLRQKAGLRPKHWSPGLTARRFAAIEMKED